jgi:hypothetical protein
MKRTKSEIQKSKFNSFAEISMAAYCEDEPIAIRITQAGWVSPQQYHVLIEFGDMEQTTYKGTMTADQIKEEYGLIISEHTLSKYPTDYPNNMDLGKELRSILDKYKQKTEI